MRRLAALMLPLAATLALLAPAAGPPPRPALPVKEPAYQSKAPRYAVLTFGRDRVWVVLDGDALFADRNGDGDLTDKTERKKSVGSFVEGGTIYEFGNLRRIGGKKAQLRITSEKDGERVSLTVGGTNYRLVVPGPKGLRFAARPQDAPVIPFEGPLQMIAVTPKLVGNREYALTAHIGTPLPGGGYVAVCEDWPPDDAHPVAELTFANKTKGGPPVRLTVTLKKRC
jgi:hypothetical protein